MIFGNLDVYKNVTLRISWNLRMWGHRGRRQMQKFDIFLKNHRRLWRSNLIVIVGCASASKKHLIKFWLKILQEREPDKFFIFHFDSYFGCCQRFRYRPVSFIFFSFFFFIEDCHLIFWQARTIAPSDCGTWTTRRATRR